MVGLFAFFYLMPHFSTYAVLDTSFDLAYVIEDVTDRLYITVVFAAFVMLVPMAATSTNAMVRRLGPLRLRRLHRLVYAGILTVLLAARLPVVVKWMQACRSRSAGRRAAAV